MGHPTYRLKGTRLPRSKGRLQVLRAVVLSAALVAAGLSPGRPICPLAGCTTATAPSKSCCAAADSAPSCCTVADHGHRPGAIVPAEQIVPRCPHCPLNSGAPCCQSAPARTVTAVRVDPSGVVKDDAEACVPLAPSPRFSNRSPERSAFESSIASSLGSIPVARHVRFCVWLV